MNKKDKARVVYVASAMVKFWQRLEEEAKTQKDPSWHRCGERQAYHDALAAMKYAKLIDDYSLKGIVMDGAWIYVEPPGEARQVSEGCRKQNWDKENEQNKLKGNNNGLRQL